MVLGQNAGFIDAILAGSIMIALENVFSKKFRMVTWGQERESRAPAYRQKFHQSDRILPYSPETLFLVFSRNCLQIMIIDQSEPVHEDSQSDPWVLNDSRKVLHGSLLAWDKKNIVKSLRDKNGGKRDSCFSFYATAQSIDQNSGRAKDAEGLVSIATRWVKCERRKKREISIFWRGWLIRDPVWPGYIILVVPKIRKFWTMLDLRPFKPHRSPKNLGQAIFFKSVCIFPSIW